jgi:hypothetical protein
MLIPLVAGQTSPALPPGWPGKLLPITVPVVDAGVYEADTGALHAPELAAAGRDVIYDNTCEPAFWFPLDMEGLVAIDEGALPAPTSLQVAGCRTAYEVNAIRIAYCTRNVAPSAVLSFYTPFPTCNPAVLDQSPVGRIVLPGLPGSSQQGELTCWTLEIELGRQAFVIAAYGNGGAPGGSSFYFAYAVEFPSTSAPFPDGMIVAGQDVACPAPQGTVWYPNGQDDPPDGTGWLTDLGMLLFVHPPSGQQNCFITSWEPYSWFLELHSDDACPPEAGTPYCFGREEGACPCANARFADTGCDNAQLTGGLRLRALDFAPDGMGGGTVTLQGSNLPFFSTPAVVALRSLTPEDPPAPFGDGLRCVGLPGLTRVGATLASAGMGSVALSHGAGPGTFHYQLWYRNLPASYCTPAGFNLSNAYALSW